MGSLGPSGVLFVLLCILGLLANGFIVLVLSREWVRRGRLLPSVFESVWADDHKKCGY